METLLVERPSVLAELQRRLTSVTTEDMKKLGLQPIPKGYKSLGVATTRVKRLLALKQKLAEEFRRLLAAGNEAEIALARELALILSQIIRLELRRLFPALADREFEICEGGTVVVPQQQPQLFETARREPCSTRSDAVQLGGLRAGEY